MQCIKTLLLSALLLAMFTGVGQADVFGLKKGMTVEQVRALEFGKLEKVRDTSEEIWEVKNPQMPKGAGIAMFIIVPGKGLLKAGFFWNIETNAYGDAIKQKFRELKNILSEKYGTGQTIDFLKQGSIWTQPQYWMNALVDKDRMLFWYSDKGLTNELTYVFVEAVGTTSRKGHINLGYEFQGWVEYVNARDKQDASQF